MPTLESSSSSTAASSSSPPQAYASETANLNYAFLVHSQKTLTQNLPPRVDNKLLARQKRRRTSPEDHAVLEAEYKKNPKPDKAARASIVSRVALGEKEVQIWFQNRRQNDRRKSKPLEPHELIAPRALKADDAPPSSQSTGLNASFGSDDRERNEDEDTKAAEAGEGEEGDIVPGVCNSSSDVELPSSQLNGEVNSSQTTHPLSETANANQEKLAENPEGITGLGIDVMSRKRVFSEVDTVPPPADTNCIDFKSPPSLRISMSFDGEALVRQKGEPTPSPPKPCASLRISMSSDGEALIRNEDEPSPSKNRMRMVPSRTRRQSGLRRSTSAVAFGAIRPAMVDREGEPRAFGRSRDARMWELYCDTDTRSALSTPASSQGTPGAGGTPGLYRSGSHRSLARTSSFSRSTFSARPELDSHRAAVEFSGEKRRKLARTVSSLGRLESGLADRYPAKALQAAGKAPKDRGEQQEQEQDTGDSDKENWLPGTQARAAPRRHRRVASHAPRAVLRENGLRRNTTVDDLALAAGGKTGRVSRGLRGSNKENEFAHPGKMDAEVAAFMSKTGSSSRAEDLDCIQGLLSLSQGAWR